MQRAFVYIREDAEISDAQEPLKEWNDNINLKVEKLHTTLNTMI